MDRAERALQLADVAFAQRDIEAMVAHLSAAVRGFTAADQPCRAAMACVRLGEAYATWMGNMTAARAWFTRARRLVESVPECVEQGWVAVAAMGCDVDDSAELLASAEFALDRARRFGDVNLETKALADAGLAHVQSGRIVEGMRLLDEAMVLACDLADDRDTASKSVCSFFTACYYAADFERAGSWTEVLCRHGLIGPMPGGQVFLSSHCDSVQAALLLELGRWGEAEELLQRAKAQFEAAMPFPSWHPDIALAELRIRQGRFTEAEVLLLGKDQLIQALLPAARLHLARGDHELARAAARRGLRVIGADRLRAVELLTVEAEAALSVGDIDAAVAACDELTARARDLDLAAMQARSAITRARVLAASGSPAASIDLLETAVDGLDTQHLPWLRAVSLLELARLRELAGDRAAATIDATSAASALRSLDVVLTEREADLLERLVGAGAVVGAEHRRSVGRAQLIPDGSWWTVSFDGRHVRLTSTKGLRYVAELVARPGVERHVLDLVDRVEGSLPGGGADRRALGDAGEVLDAQARSEYRHRIEALRAQVDDAVEADQSATAEALQGELDMLVAELARAFGLGGRSRRAGSASERARLNVTRAIRSATAKLAVALPGAGQVLDRQIRTGTYCIYEPDGDEVCWIVQSPVNTSPAD